jgi:DNA polymerase-3 subunit beta
MPAPDLGDGIPINVSDLKEIIQQVAFAASTDEARPILTGVLVTVNGDQLTLASADGFRLSVRKAILSSPISRPVQSVVPARALSELARIISNGDQVVTMTLPPDRGQVVFQMKDIQLVSHSQTTSR